MFLPNCPSSFAICASILRIIYDENELQKKATYALHSIGQVICCVLLSYGVMGGLFIGSSYLLYCKKPRRKQETIPEWPLDASPCSKHIAQRVRDAGIDVPVAPFSSQDEAHRYGDAQRIVDSARKDRSGLQSTTHFSVLPIAFLLCIAFVVSGDQLAARQSRFSSGLDLMTKTLTANHLCIVT
ncbi:hypothetical protein DFJ77DRAFT_14377 [Powellomyces hirtus]|nr:hypothetical protein DFJ77DRAFT_14377 [Powellomyces hirtus]